MAIAGRYNGMVRAIDVDRRILPMLRPLLWLDEKLELLEYDRRDALDKRAALGTTRASYTRSTPSAVSTVAPNLNHSRFI